MKAAEKSASDEKMKYIVLGIIGTIAIVYALYASVFGPMQAQKVKMKETLDELDVKLQKAKQKVSRMPAMEKRIKGYSIEIYDISDKYLLKPQLGNYFIQVKEYITLVAVDSDIELTNISEVGLEDYPKSANSRLSHNTLKAYSVRLNMVGGFHALIRFLKYLETDNPYMVVESVKVSSDEEDPSAHKISMNLQWPVWSSEEYLKKYSKPLMSEGKR